PPARRFGAAQGGRRRGRRTVRPAQQGAEGKGEVARRGKPSPGVFSETTADDAFDFGRYLRAEARQEGRFVVQHVRRRFGRRPALKEAPPRHQFIQDTAHGKQVAAGIDLQSAKLFGRHVPDRTHRGARVCVPGDVGSGFWFTGRRVFDKC